MPIDGPVDHTGGRAGADGAESAAGRRGCSLRGRCVFARCAHRPVPAPAPAEPPDQKPKKKKPPKSKKEKPKKQSAPPDIRTILALAKLGLQALDRFRQRLRVQLLRLVFVSGASDPYDTALAFGYVNAALGALTPLAERALRIDERDIQTGVDFQAERPRIDARIVCTIRIGQIVIIALAFGAGFLKQKMHAKQARSARAKTAPATQERKVSNG